MVWDVVGRTAPLVVAPRFQTPVQIVNPGEPDPIDGFADLWQTAAGEFDEEGTLLASWSAMMPFDTLVKPLAEVFVPSSGRLYWVAGLPEQLTSLLSNVPSHVEMPLRYVLRLPASIDVFRDADADQPSSDRDRNRFGDEVETGRGVPADPSSPYLADVTGSITELTAQVPDNGDLRTVRVVVGWLPAGTDVRRGDRIRSGPSWYAVEQVTQPIRTGLLDLRLDLTAID